MTCPSPPLGPILPGFFTCVPFGDQEGCCARAIGPAPRAGEDACAPRYPLTTDNCAIKEDVAKDSLLVIDGKEKVPFLRGMVTHSLIERGMNFRDAYQTASRVKDLLKRKKTITKMELAEVIDGVVREKFGHDYTRLKRPIIDPSRAILVKGENNLPFSKGLLANSLQSSGLDPSAAYDIAREIEKNLQRSGRREVPRDELRRLIYQTILQNHGSDYAERYVLWRCFKSPDKPLVILFGGATGTGKTSIASEIAHRLGIQRILATDIVRQMMRMMFSHDLLPAIHHSSYEAWKELVAQSGNRSEVVIEAFKEQSIRVMVGVRAMIERAIEENFNLVIEGVHLVPGLSGLEQFKDRCHVVPVVISTLNRDAYMERFPLREAGAANRPAQRYRENFEYILQIQDYILEMADFHNTPIIENVSFDQTVSSIITVISNSLREELNVSRAELLALAL